MVLSLKLEVVKRLAVTNCQELCKYRHSMKIITYKNIYNMNFLKLTYFLVIAFQLIACNQIETKFKDAKNIFKNEAIVCMENSMEKAAVIFQTDTPNTPELIQRSNRIMIEQLREIDINTCDEGFKIRFKALISCFELISDKMDDGELDKENADLYLKEFEKAVEDVSNYSKSKGAKVPADLLRYFHGHLSEYV